MKRKTQYAIGTYKWVDKTPWERFVYKLKVLVRRVLIVTGGAIAILTVGFSSYALGAINMQGISLIKGNTMQIPPVLERIARCESSNQNVDKTGQVLMRANKNGSVDVGKYQINSIWFKQASDLHYDLTKPADNLAFAMWLYQNKGTGAWVDSANCWNK